MMGGSIFITHVTKCAVSRTPYAVSSARVCVNPNYMAVKSDVLDVDSNDTAVKNNILEIRMYVCT